jgi:ABC-type lipoprotein release transport system permease subunit
MSSMQEGTYSNNIDMMVQLSSGYLQVQHPEYQEHKSINHAIAPDDSLWKAINSVEEITRAVPRLESFGLLSSGNKTKGGAIIGIKPKADNVLSNLKNWLHKGSYLNTTDNGALLTYNIANYLDIGLNDTLVIMSQGYHGATAAGIYPIKGILKFNTPQLNNLGVFIGLKQAQQLFSAFGKATNIKIMVDNYSDVKPAQKALSKKLGENYNILSWRELQPELVQFIDSDRQSGAVMKLILYIIIGFGILGTVIMMMAERQKEFGVMIAIGLQKTKLAIITLFETLFIGLVGVVSGFIISVPVIYIFVDNPIPLPPDLAEAYANYGFEPFLFFSIKPSVFYNQVITVFVITLIVAIYPVWNIGKMKVANALRS